MIYDKMEDCFNTLKDKVSYALDHSDLESIYTTLASIQGHTIVTGLGGSSIVAHFLAKVLREKNHMIATFVTNRDILYMDLGTYENIIVVSYSSGNIGVDICVDNHLKKYLFTGRYRDGFENMVYGMEKEVSYVSISATLVPLCILFMYYQRDRGLLEAVLSEDVSTLSNSDLYEVMSGYETSTASMMLESCMIEGGLAALVMHDKYNFCHGRINLSKLHQSDLIVYKGTTEIEALYEEHLYKYYNQVIELPYKYDDLVVNDFYLTYLSLQLVHKIALNKQIDISDMQEVEDNDIFYLFKGKLI